MNDVQLLSAARAGDAASFEALVSAHRGALVAHCYRLLGSPSDAEDAVQDALVRAWRGLAGFDGRASLRTWLYRIATNACLTSLERSPRRFMTDDLVPPARRDDPPGAPRTDVAWIEPCPQAFWNTPPAPDARYSAKESVAVAFLAILQSLPPQQRAVLIFRDVLGWSAAETAEALDTTVVAANSALQRAREGMEKWREGGSNLAPDDTRVRGLLTRYVSAWESGDVDAIAALLHEEARLTMPPVPMWFSGRASIAAFLTGLLPQFGSLRLLPFEASGGPAAAMYVRGPDGVFRAHSMQVLSSAENGSIVRVDAFMNAADFARFGLPAVLPPG